MLTHFRAFVSGDMDDYQRLAARARSSPESGMTIASAVFDSIITMFAGDFVASHGRASDATNIARETSDAYALAWTLAHQSVMVGRQSPSEAISLGEQALTVARGVPGTLTRLYPLLSIVTSNESVDPPRARAAADEAYALDRTQRRWWATIVTNNMAGLSSTPIATLDRLVEWREVFASLHERQERILLSSSIASAAIAVAASDSELAADLAAIAESDAIAPAATFTAHPTLIRLALDHPEIVAEARARASRMSYEAAVEQTLASIDAALAAHRIDDEV
jgi:hypothetical protein